MGITIETRNRVVEFTGFSGAHPDKPLCRSTTVVRNSAGAVMQETLSISRWMSPREARAYRYAEQKGLSTIDLTDVPASWRDPNSPRKALADDRGIGQGHLMFGVSHTPSISVHF